MNRRLNWEGATYKEWIGLAAAPVFWIASLVCFVLGLAFRQDSGIFIHGIGIDMTMLFSVGLGFANTAIQIVGNDTDRSDMGMALWLMWIGSYMLGIGSNINFLNQRIGLDTQILQFLVVWGLGVMIEVAPERLLVKFLRAIGVLGGNRPEIQPAQANNSRQTREQRHESMRQSHSTLPIQPIPIRPMEESPRPDSKMHSPKGGKNLPEFLRRRTE